MGEWVFAAPQLFAYAVGLVGRTNIFEGTVKAILGFNDFTFHKPVHPGGTIHVVATIVEAAEPDEQLTTADFVLTVGCSLNPHTHDSGGLIRDEAKTVHVDTDPMSIGQYLDVDLAIYGDAKTTAEKFTQELTDEGIDRTGEFWTEANRERIANSSTLSDRDFPEQAGRMDSRELVPALDQILPRDRLVVTDVGHFTTFVIDGITVRHPDEFIWKLDFTAVGQGLSIGIGAALSATDRNCITFCGDAGFMMALQGVETAARQQVPIKIIERNDATLGAEYHQARNVGYSGDVAVIDTPDLAAVAEGLGAEGHPIRSKSDIDAMQINWKQRYLGRSSSTAESTVTSVIDCTVDERAGFNHQRVSRSSPGTGHESAGSSRW